MPKRKAQTRIADADAYSLAPLKCRIAELNAMGFTGGCLKLAGGRKPSGFVDLCRVPYRIYTAFQVPCGPRVVPMWESAHSTTTTLARRHGDATLEIIEYNLESPDTWSVVAHNEQGALARCFLRVADLHLSMADGPTEVQSAIKQLKKWASQLSFQHLADTIDLVTSGANEKKMAAFVSELD